MLAAIVPRDKGMWFFKLAGPNEAVKSESGRFLAFIKSLDFPDAGDASPTWTLPEGWRLSNKSADGGSGISRAATIEIGAAEKPLELAVTTFPTVGDPGNFVLQNVNRWRGQMGDSPLGSQDLVGAPQAGEGELGETTRLLIDGSTATLVNLQGTLASGGMGRAPFASAKPATPSAPPAAEAARDTGAPKFDVPDGWTAAQGTGLSVASYRVGQGDGTAEVTVTPLAAAAGDLASNVNRWRTQLKLKAWTAAELQENVKPIDVGGTQGSFVEFSGPESSQPREAILGVIVVQRERAWFIKLRGDAEVAKGEKERFESFVRSAKFTEGAGNVN